GCIGNGPWNNGRRRTARSFAQYYTKNVDLKMAWCAHSEQSWPIKPLTRAQAIENRRRGKAIGHRPDRGLERPQGIPAPGAEPSVGFPDIVALLRQELLQFIPLGASEHTLMPRPRLHDRLAPAQAIAEVPDRQRIGLRRVVLHDHPKVLQHDE